MNKAQPITSDIKICRLSGLCECLYPASTFYVTLWEKERNPLLAI